MPAPITFGFNYPCAICGKPVVVPSVEVGRDSDYPNAVICPRCARRYIDPAIERAIAVERHVRDNATPSQS